MKNLLNNSCPSCGKQKIFPSNHSWWMPLAFPKMNSHCSACSYQYNKEPGYFFGAAYVTYALGTAQVLIALLVASQYIENPWWVVAVAIGLVILLAPINYKLSRLIWLNLLYKV